MQQVRWVEANMLSVSFCYQSAAHLHAAPPAPAEAVEELAPSGSNWRHLETDRDRSAMDWLGHELDAAAEVLSRSLSTSVFSAKLLLL